MALWLPSRRVLAAVVCAAALGAGTGRAAETPDPPPPRISVDSTFPGYDPSVLSDGKRIEAGREPDLEFGHPDRLGNGGNTWVSGEAKTDHWIRLDWVQPVEIGEVEIWWSLSEWYPRAFRVERLETTEPSTDGNDRWVPFGPGEGWLAPTDRRSVIAVPPAELRALRIFQPPEGAPRRGLLAAQEVNARRGGARGSTPSIGVRQVSAGEFARLRPRPLLPNIARLGAETPGAAEAFLISPDGTETPASARLIDGDAKVGAVDLEAGGAVGIRWPIEHGIVAVALAFSERAPEASSLVLEVHDGRDWVPVTWGPRPDRTAEGNRIAWAFEPAATRAVRICRAGTGDRIAVAELEVDRYLPPGKDVWPGKLTGRPGLGEEMLVRPEDPSYEALALRSLSMQSARALLGLKDGAHEIGVTWDGTAIGRDTTIEFFLGPERLRLVEFPDLVRRELVDGWRPGVVITGRIGDLDVRETAFVGAHVSERAASGALFVRIALRNLAANTLATRVEAHAHGAEVAVAFDLEIPPGTERSADFIHYLDSAAPTVQALRRAGAFDGALRAFRACWDDILAGSATTVEVPEPRLNLLVKAILAQCFINGDGSIMRYGSEPSVYSEELFGIEESYPILALAMFGFGQDAQRYLDGTYLTREFLRKSEVYAGGVARHQQYRNGLQPHYAVSVYRLTRDAAWIRKHVQLLRDCAEWTAVQRRRTMVGGGGERPLHGGLLPEWAYGGDIGDVRCHALYGNLCCWRGLVDTAWLLGELGDAPTAERYAAEAREYRAAIDRAIDGSYQSHRQPPFLPLRLYATEPDEQQDYYQLFAGCLLDLDAFPRGSRHLRWIADFLEADNRTVCFLPRFRRDVGAGGLDALYGKGYLLALLREGAVREFLLGFYAFQAFNLERATLASRETNALYPGDLHVRSTYGVPEMSDPLPCSSAVVLQLLRHLLVTEESAGPGEVPDTLRLLPGAPRAWLRDGRAIRLRDLPTAFGPVGLEVRSAAAAGRIAATLDPPARQPCRKIVLRLRHPEARPLRAVMVNGELREDFDRAREELALPGGLGRLHIEAVY